MSAFPWDEWLRPAFAGPVTDALSGALDVYLELLLRWNARTNLTSVRDPEGIARRHLAESLFLAENLPDAGEMPRTLLDHGSGAGFPGLLIALYRPDIQATLSESQHKKSAFLREAVRALALTNVTVHSGRTDGLSAKFTWITSRAVDCSVEGTAGILERVCAGGWLIASRSEGLSGPHELRIPESHSRYFVHRVP